MNAQSTKRITKKTENAIPKFPGWNLRRFTKTDRGPAELLSVSVTSDGFAIGMVRFSNDGEPYVHDVFLGLASDLRNK